MSATTAAGLGDLFVYNQLVSDATLMGLVSGVYAVLAPEGSVPPYVVFGQAAGVDVRGMGGLRSLTQPVYTVRAIAAIGSIAGLDAIAQRIDVALQAIQASIAGGQVYGCERLSIVSMGVPEAGVQYRQIVQTYRLALNPA